MHTVYFAEMVKSKADGVFPRSMFIINLYKILH